MSENHLAAAKRYVCWRWIGGVGGKGRDAMQRRCYFYVSVVVDVKER